MVLFLHKNTIRQVVKKMVKMYFISFNFEHFREIIYMQTSTHSLGKKYNDI